MDQMTFNLPAGAPLSLVALLLNLGVGLGLSLALRWHFERFGSTLSNRGEFAQVFPSIVLTTVLIITVVKSSLALSLGLVGALSIDCPRWEDGEQGLVALNDVIGRHVDIGDLRRVDAREGTMEATYFIDQKQMPSV